MKSKYFIVLLLIGLLCSFVYFSYNYGITIKYRIDLYQSILNLKNEIKDLKFEYEKLETDYEDLQSLEERYVLQHKIGEKDSELTRLEFNQRNISFLSNLKKFLFAFGNLLLIVASIIILKKVNNK